MSKTKKVAEAIDDLCELTDELIEKLSDLVAYAKWRNCGDVHEVIEAEKVLRKARGEE